MATTSLHISLSEDLKQDALERIKKERYSNPTDYVRNLIRQDILRAKARDEFAEFIKKGITSPSCGQSPTEMIAEIRGELK